MIPKRDPRLKAKGIAVLGAALVLFAASAGNAHQATPGVLALKQIAPGRFLMQWTAPFPPIDDLNIQFPAGCHFDGTSVVAAEAAAGLGATQLLDCGVSDLVGRIRFESPEATPARITVNVEWLDGTESFLLSSGSPPSVTLRGTRHESLSTLREYLGLGFEHILHGIDHLLFLVGLLLLVRGWRRLFLTVSAFTVAHSITLAAASLGFVTLPTGPIEICIALSVLLLALETRRGPETATRRWPWAVAFAFGLLHGLGFASALAEVGFPARAMALALLGFNLGVECGQLAVVGAVTLGYQLMNARPQLRSQFAWATSWCLGVCSVYWLLQRTEFWLSGLRVLSSIQ